MSNYVVHKADLEQLRSDIAAIRSNNLKVGPDDNYFWKYESSPYGRAECWIAFHKPSGRYVGAASLYPRVVYVKGEPRNVWVAGDYSVNVDHRGTGLAIMILKKLDRDLRENDKYTWLYGIPNRKSRPLFYRAGCKRLGYHHKYVKVISAEYLIRKTRIKSRIASAPLDWAIRLWSRESRYVRPQGISAVCIDGFDDRFDLLWKTVRFQYPIIGERTARFLRWRYSDESGKKYSIFALCRNDELIGYVVFYVRSQSCFVDDILCHRDLSVAGMLTAEFSRFCRESGFESIHAKYFGSSLFTKVFREYGFHVREKNSDEIVIYVKNDNDMSDLLNEEHWHFLNGDSD